MRLITFAVTSVILAEAAAAAAQSPVGEPIVQVGVFGYRQDGSNESGAYDTEPALASLVYASGTLCQTGAGLREPPAWAMHAWRFSGRVISKSPEEAVVQLTWQRVLDHGIAGTAAEDSVQLTLRAGETTTLETVYAQPDSRCSTRASFEARYLPRRVRPNVGVGGIGSSGVHSGAGAGGAGDSRAGSGGRIAAGAAWMDVNLWLVHSAPGRKDQVVYQLVRAPQEGASFAFAPISIETSRGAVSVQVRGSFSVTERQQLIFVTTRSVKYLFQSARDGAPDALGTGRTVNPMPAPDDVLSFEMPRIPGLHGDPALPDRLSVRVRITPRSTDYGD